MFDIGFSEILLLLVVGLVVLGPTRLPIAIRTVMGWVKTIRGLAANVQNELKQELKLQELQETLKKAESLKLQEFSPELSQSVAELKLQADKIRAELEAQARETGTTLEEHIKAVKNSVEGLRETEDHANLTNPTEGETLNIVSEQTSNEEINTSNEVIKDSHNVDLSQLEAHEHAQLTERLSDYYPPDDEEYPAQSTTSAKS